MSVELKPASVIEMDLGLEPYGDAHKYFADRCMFRMNARYVPEDTGTLHDEAYRDSECNIVYDQLYAGYQYYGMRKDGTHVVKNYSKKETRPYQGPYWDQLMVTAEREELLQDMKDYFNGEAK